MRVSVRPFCVAVVLAISFSQTADAQRFGSAVAASDDQILIGDGANPAFPGSVYVFERDADGAWTEAGRLTASDARRPVAGIDDEDNRADRFGSAVAVASDVLVVGAPGVRSVYVFVAEDDTWREVTRLRGDEAGFGAAVTTDGRFAVVGVPGDDETRGEVHVFDREMNWDRVARFLPDDVTPGDEFARSLAVADGVIVAGAPGTRDDAGTAYWFARDSATGSWDATGRLSIRVASPGSRFGETVSFVGTPEARLAVGMPGFAERTGTVAIFSRDGEGWSLSERLSPFSAVNAEQFGSAVAASGNELWVGAPGYGGRFGAGAVYTFTLAGDMPSDVAAAVADHLGRGGTDAQTRGLGYTTASTILTVRDLQHRSSFGSAIAAAGGFVAVGATGFDNGAGAGFAFTRESGSWRQSTPLVNETISYGSIVGEMVECEQDLAGDFPCRGVDMTSFLSVSDLGADRGIRLNDLWGWRDETSGREYAIVGLSNQASFVDVTDPFNPRYLGKLPMPETANMSVWRDMKVYRDHAFIVSDGAGDHGMQVFDLRQLRGVTTPRTFEPTAHYRGIHSAHNIVINEETGFAYSVGSSSGGETCGGGLHMIDVRDPANPVFAGCFSDGTTGRRGTGYSHDAQCVVYDGPDSEYAGREICIGSNETALSIADVTDKSQPRSVAIASYPGVQYTHQGWLTEDQRYFYVNDELDENAGVVDGTRTLIFDLADLDDPLLVGQHIASTTETDHNLYVRGNLMYQSNTGAGLRILDISDPEKPFETAFFDTSPVGGRGGSWSNYPYFDDKIVVTAGHYGLFILRKTDVSF